MFMAKHVHRWNKVKETYAPSMKEQGWENFNVGQNVELGEKMAFGVTTILWECDDIGCDKIRKEEMLGK